MPLWKTSLLAFAAIITVPHTPGPKVLRRFAPQDDDTNEKGRPSAVLFCCEEVGVRRWG
jgi:hypothetical protein